MPPRRPEFNKTKRVKAVARQRVGSPKPVRVIVDKSSRAHPKYKKPILDSSEE